MIETQSDKSQIWRLLSSRRAVSEIIGYIIILGTILSAVAIIYVIATPMMQEAQDNAKFNNMLAGFSVLRSDLDMVALTSVPIKTTNLNTGDEYIYADPSTMAESKIIINVSDFNGMQLLYSESSMGVIKYTYKGRIIAYENGGVFEGTIGSSSFVLREEPKIYVDHLLEPPYNNTVISIINITGTFASVGGAGLAKIIISSPQYREIFNDSSQEVNLNITIKSEFAQAWMKHLQDQGFQNITFSDKQVSAEIFTKVIIGEHRINVGMR